MIDPSDGVVDTNVFLHAHANHPHTAECAAFLAALARGTVHARLRPVVLHELTYTLPRLVQQLTRAGVAAYLLVVLGWPGIRGETDILRDAVRRWGAVRKLGFVDAYLAALAAHDACPVYTKNVRDFAGQGVTVPDPLPDGTAP